MRNFLHLSVKTPYKAVVIKTLIYRHKYIQSIGEKRI